MMLPLINVRVDYKTTTCSQTHASTLNIVRSLVPSRAPVILRTIDVTGVDGLGFLSFRLTTLRSTRSLGDIDGAACAVHLTTVHGGYHLFGCLSRIWSLSWVGLRLRYGRGKSTLRRWVNRVGRGERSITTRMNVVRHDRRLSITVRRRSLWGGLAFMRMGNEPPRVRVKVGIESFSWVGRVCSSRRRGWSWS